MNDLKFAFRQLLKNPGFTAVAVLTLALGIGANTAIFSVVNAVLIRPLPYQDSSQLVFVWRDLTATGKPRSAMAGPELTDLQQEATLFSGFAGIWPNTATITGGGDPEQLRIGFVTTNFFDTLGANVLFGRTFEKTDPPTAIVLSWPLWQRRYGGDPSVLGRNLIVNGQPSTVVGVMPPEFRLLFPPDANVPEYLDAWLLGEGIAGVTDPPRRTRYLRVIGRMKPGVPLAQAREEVARIAARVSREHADYGAAALRLNMVGLQSEGAREIRPVVLALLGGVAILLLTACLNVASLLIARAAARTKETAMRLALGASHRQVLQQCLIEGLILTFIGGGVGVLFAEFSLRVLVALRPAALHRLSSANIDTTVLAFTAGTALFWGILFSLAPMIEVIRTDVIGTLLGSTRRIGASRYRTRALLVTVQIALGVMLLVGAGLMIRTFISLQQVDPGYRSKGMLTFRVHASPDRYGSQMALNQFHQLLQTELGALPGVRGVGSVSHLPFDPLAAWASPYISAPGQDPSAAAFADYRAVSPGYLDLIGARLLAGRFFAETDHPGSQPVVIVDDLLAKRTWPGESALGKRLQLFHGTGDWWIVVGVVRHMRIRSLVEDMSDQVYLPIRQLSRPTTYVVQTSGHPAELAGPVRDLIRRLDPQLPVDSIRPMEDYLIDARSTQRFTMLLAGAFAGVALALAVVGVYGLVSYSVNARRREFGVRLALGARSRHILGLVLVEGVTLVGVGMIVGLAAAAMVARILQSQLFAVAPHDLPTYAMAAVGIAFAGLLASWLPARRASLSNPSEVLRSD